MGVDDAQGGWKRALKYANVVVEEQGADGVLIGQRLAFESSGLGVRKQGQTN